VSEHGLRDLIRFRLHSHGLLGTAEATLESVARHMLAVQAQDYGQAG
jgi:hypothetical protein